MRQGELNECSILFLGILVIRYCYFSFFLFFSLSFVGQRGGEECKGARRAPEMSVNELSPMLRSSSLCYERPLFSLLNSFPFFPQCFQ